MNERMLELYKQAHIPHTRIDPSNNMPYESTIFSANKFAELIIQECMKEMGISKQCDPYTGEVYASDYNRAIDDQISMLAEHFGFE